MSNPMTSPTLASMLAGELDPTNIRASTDALLAEVRMRQVVRIPEHIESVRQCETAKLNAKFCKQRNWMQKQVIRRLFDARPMPDDWPVIVEPVEQPRLRAVKK